jgi:hypothetical protein
LKQRLWELKFSLVQGRGAVLKTGLAPLDLRHTFNTNMRKAGVDRSVIMKITGHKTTAMFHRYNTVDSEDARSAMDRYEGFLRNQITSGLLQDYFTHFRKVKKKGQPNGQPPDFLGAGGRNRTDMTVRPGDFAIRRTN